MTKRDFLRLSDLTLAEHHRLLARAHSLKARRAKKQVDRTLEGRTLVLIFEKASTRTRLSFEAAMGQLGGQAITLPFDGSQMARGEPLGDTARVVSGYADCIMMRTFADARIQEFARAATVPVINGLTDGAHPVQLLADLMTMQERLGSIEGRTVAFVGDGATNMALSWMEAARLFGFSLRLASPEGYRPPAAEVKDCGSRLFLTASPQEAVAGAEVVVTDVWTSMGQEAETAKRLAAFKGYCVNEALMAHAQPGAIVLHCLPAHRGEEISGGVLDGPQSAAWDEAENR
ncbi:MAG TPA: ornithine carbamoyltransferase, partial [Aggregicoccus sp.]|nr:ornithine carbamoyltransferase [Aggregicoccus sp.]